MIKNKTVKKILDLLSNWQCQALEWILKKKGFQCLCHLHQLHYQEHTEEDWYQDHHRGVILWVEYENMEEFYGVDEGDVKVEEEEVRVEVID